MAQTSRSASFTPPGWHAVTPRIIVDDPQPLVAFLKHVFAATGEYQAERPSVIAIGDVMLMISSGAGIRERAVAFLYVYVEDADATYRRAMEAGATSVEPPGDMPYGDRRAMVTDRWGNTWQIATYRGIPEG